MVRHVQLSFFFSHPPIRRKSNTQPTPLKQFLFWSHDWHVNITYLIKYDNFCSMWTMYVSLPQAVAAIRWLPELAGLLLADCCCFGGIASESGRAAVKGVGEQNLTRSCLARGNMLGAEKPRVRDAEQAVFAYQSVGERLSFYQKHHFKAGFSGIGEWKLFTFFKNHLSQI